MGIYYNKYGRQAGPTGMAAGPRGGEFCFPFLGEAARVLVVLRCDPVTMSFLSCLHEVLGASDAR